MYLYICSASLPINIIIILKIAISNGPHQGHKTSSALETHQEKSSEVIIPVLEHV